MAYVAADQIRCRNCGSIGDPAEVLELWQPLLDQIDRQADLKSDMVFSYTEEQIYFGDLCLPCSIAAHQKESLAGDQQAVSLVYGVELN